MTTYGNQFRIPPGLPPALFDASIENVLDATTVTVTRTITVDRLGVVVSGNQAGVNPLQPGRLVLYTDAAGTPGTLIARSIQGEVSGVNPTTRGVSLPIDGAPVVLTPGTYWVGVHVGVEAGQGEWNIHGGPGPGSGIKVTGVVYPNTPATWPAGGTTFPGSEASYGMIGTPNATEAFGAICGTFLCGPVLVGTITFPFNYPGLSLNGGQFQVLVAGDIEDVKMGKPSLVLEGKAFSAFASSRVEAGKAVLLLNAEPANGAAQAPQNFAKPVLVLEGRSFVLSLSQGPQAGKPRLNLLGRKARGFTPGLVPTVPQDVTLQPSGPGLAEPTPVVAETVILQPTVESFV